MGWGGLAAGGVDVRVVPGNHFTIVHEQDIDGLAPELKRCIDEAFSRAVTGQER
jgi:thioesterase domain-containing protein